MLEVTAWTLEECDGAGGTFVCQDVGGADCAVEDRGDGCWCECHIPTSGPEACDDLSGVPFCIGDKTGLICWEDSSDVDCRCRCTVGPGIIGTPCDGDEDCLDALVCQPELAVCVRRCFEDRQCNRVSCVDSSYCSIRR